MAPSATYIAYGSDVEHLEAEEAGVGADIRASLQTILDTTSGDSKHAIRSVHAKSHGLLRGELQVLPGLALPWAQGLFAEPRTYPVVLRLSTTPGDILDDRVSTPRGMALKVVGVPGARLPGSEGDTTQDFVLVNGPVFLQPDGKRFAPGLKLLAATTDKVPALKRALSALLRGAEHAVEAVGGDSSTLKLMGGHPLTHPLGETFYSQAPLLHGAHMAKISLAPASAALQALTDAPLALEDPDGLRGAVVDFFAQQGAEWVLRAQLCTDLDTLPIEDASVEWSQEASPWHAVARVVVPPQRAWSDERARAIDDGMSFTPWHGIAAHRPLGSIMRLRREAYAMSARFRAERNGQPVVEPRTLDTLPD